MKRAKHVSRRGFLHGIAGGAAALTAAVSAIDDAVAETLADLHAMEAPEEEKPARFDGGYWAKIREQFMLEEGLAYMNNGTLGPTPIPVYEAMVEYWRLMAVNPHENSLILQRRTDEVVRRKAAEFLDVDGAHSPGMIRVSLRDWGVDGFACNAHKWLCGPAGAGILFVRREVQDRIWPNIAIHSGDPKDARKYAHQVGRRPWPAVAALEHTLDFHLAVGRERIEQRLRSLGSYLRESARKIPKVRLYTSNDARLSAGITRLGIEGVSGKELAAYLRKRYDVYVPPGGEAVRISTHFYNTFEQVNRVLEALGELSSRAAPNSGNF